MLNVWYIYLHEWPRFVGSMGQVAWVGQGSMWAQLAEVSLHKVGLETSHK